MRQRLWHMDRGVFSLVLCETCGEQPVKWNEKASTYRRYCGHKCAHRSDAVREKTRNTCLERYGTTSTFTAAETAEKIKSTMIERYGADNYFKTAGFKDELRQVCLERYGVDNASKSTEVKARIDRTNELRYGRRRKSQSHLTDEAYAAKNNTELMRHWFVDKRMPVTEIAELLGVNHSQLCSHFKNNLGIDISRHSVSAIERQISEYLSLLAVPHRMSDRRIIAPKELDIVSDEYRVAIELDGLAWHSELKGKDRNYHINKTLSAQRAGYRLIHIFDSEWKQQPDIVKSRLGGIFGKNQRLHARKGVILPVEKSAAADFFERTHIQGSCQCAVAYGLYIDEQLVACMSFGRPRYNRNFQWELLRFSSELGTNVVGGASRLFSAFVSRHTPSSVISYCDLRWGTGSVYKNIGFREERRTSPNYWYLKGYESPQHRSRFQKKQLPKILENFDPSLTEWDNMVANGYDRIWDCGNIVFSWYPE
jgi:very-short-patch-repair endonuclease